MSNLVELFGGTSDSMREQEEVPVTRVLEGAIEARLTMAVVIGRQPDGTLYIASSKGSDKALALIARANAFLATGQDGGLVLT